MAASIFASLGSCTKSPKKNAPMYSTIEMMSHSDLHRSM